MIKSIYSKRLIKSIYSKRLIKSIIIIKNIYINNKSLCYVSYQRRRQCWVEPSAHINGTIYKNGGLAVAPVWFWEFFWNFIIFQKNSLKSPLATATDARYCPFLTIHLKYMVKRDTIGHITWTLFDHSFEIHGKKGTQLDTLREPFMTILNKYVMLCYVVARRYVVAMWLFYWCSLWLMMWW